MKKFITSVIALAAAALSLSLAACGAQPVTKSGVLVTNAVSGVSDTEYVICISKNVEESAELLETVNAVIEEVDVNKVAANYCDYANRRANKLLESYMYNLNDNTGGPLYVMSATFEPFNYSGAGGCYTDGIDAYLMLHVAEKLDRRLIIYDMDYSYAYAQTKEGKAHIFSAGVAQSEALKTDFLVSDVYLTGNQQIVCDKNENFTSLSDLKGLTIGVLSGREGEKIVKDAIENGALKGTGATLAAYSTDTEAEAMLHTQMCDVLVIDEFPAKLIVAKAN